jgi:hypothetical protein
MRHDIHVVFPLSTASVARCAVETASVAIILADESTTP